MTSDINNHILSFRARLRCMDKPAHAAVWQNQPPAIFGIKVGLIREQLETLTTAAAAQSISSTGTAAQKRSTETALENAAFALARMVVLYAHSLHDEVVAHKFDFPLTHWRRLRDEALLQRARLLATEAETLAARDPAKAAEYNLTPEKLTSFRGMVSEYADRIVDPREAIATRSVLTANLPDMVRGLTALFDNIEDILPQFDTPAGHDFTAAYHASARIINRGHRFETPEGEEEEEEDDGDKSDPPAPSSPTPPAP